MNSKNAKKYKLAIDLAVATVVTEEKGLIADNETSRAVAEEILEGILSGKRRDWKEQEGEEGEDERRVGKRMDEILRATIKVMR